MEEGGRKQEGKKSGIVLRKAGTEDGREKEGERMRGRGWEGIFIQESLDQWLI